LSYYAATSILPFDAPASTVYDTLQAQRVRISTMDLRIASIALGLVCPAQEDQADNSRDMGPNLEAGPMHAGQRQTIETELGGFNLVDALNAPLVAARPKPRGLLSVPPEVEAVVAKEEARLMEKHGIPLIGEARQRLVDSLTLQFYYGGLDVAYRRIAERVEVLAVGPDEIGRLVRDSSPEERLKLKIGQP